MLEKLKSLLKSTRDCTEYFEEKGIYGPVGYLEEAIENIESAINEIEEYFEEEE